MLPVGTLKVETMRRRAEIQQGTLALMVLKTLDVLGAQHGFGIARRVEQISGEQLSVNQGTYIPCCFVWSRRARSGRVGAFREQ